METKECKIHGALPKTSEYFYIHEKIDKRNRSKYGKRTTPYRKWTLYRCKKCILEKGRMILKNNINNLNETYLKKCIKNNIKKITGLNHKEIVLEKEFIDIKHLQLKIERSVKYNFDNKSFSCLRHLSKYIELKINIPYRTLEKRLELGISIEEAINFKKHDKRFKTNKKISA